MFLELLFLTVTGDNSKNLFDMFYTAFFITK